MPRTRLILALSCIAIFLAGCAREPDLRSVVHENFGSKAVLMVPSRELPAPKDPSYRSNTFQFIPGALALPTKVIARADEIAGRSEVWRVAGARFCPHLAFQLDRTWTWPKFPISVDYYFDNRLRFFGSAEEDRKKAISDFPTIGKNTIGKLSKISIRLTNVRVFTINEFQMQEALRDVAERDVLFSKGRKGGLYCGFMRNKHRRDVRQVESVIVANISVDAEKAEGVNFDLNWAKLVLEKGYRYRMNGPDQIIVFVGRPLE